MKPSDVSLAIQSLVEASKELRNHPCLPLLPSVLEEGEMPKAIAGEKLFLLVATDRRLIVLKKAAMSNAIDLDATYNYDEIRSFRADMSFMSLGCQMMLKDGAIKTLQAKKKQRVQFAEVVRSYIPGHQVSQKAEVRSPAQQVKADSSNKAKPPIVAIVIALLVLALAIVGGCMWLTSGSSLPEKCPEAKSGFELGNLEWGVRNKVKDLLLNPDSYKEESIFTRPAYFKERADDTKYISRVEVTFQAEDAAGWIVHGRATVDLREDEAGCTVAGAQLYE